MILLGYKTQEAIHFCGRHLIEKFREAASNDDIPWREIFSWKAEDDLMRSKTVDLAGN